MSKTPSAILSDALTAFNRAATLAFTAAQDQARSDVTHATSDVREARRERDDAVNALHASRLEEQAWKQEAGVWKAAANQAELTINHHLETIAQLRQEATQWKNQCLRLEETSRQEAISWKEQFLRVEQERSKLAQRVEELVAEQLSAGGHAQASTPYTPMVKYPAIGDLSASTRLQHASARESSSPSLQEQPRQPAPCAFKAAWDINRTRPGLVSQLPTPISENQRSARQRITQEKGPPVPRSASTSNGTRQVLIRRVQAVVEVPVKEESVEREGVGLDKHISTSTSNITSTSTSTSTSKTPNTRPRITEPSKATTRIKRKAALKRTYVEIDNDESAGDDASHDSKHSDAEEYQLVSDDDDELLMGIETNRREVYGMKRVSKPISVRKTTRPPIEFKKRKSATLLTPSVKKNRPSAAPKP